MLPKNDPNYIGWLLTMNNKAVERAIVAIFNRQTQDEKAIGDAKHSNGIGFSGADAKTGTYYAKWILSGRNLTGRHLDKARSMSKKYIRQLTEIATQNLQAKDIERTAIQQNS